MQTLLNNEKENTETLLEQQRLNFLALVKHASQNVPFYKNHFQENGLTLKDFNSIEDIKKFPIINKTIIKENFS